jgi:TatD DNase family protein
MYIDIHTHNNRQQKNVLSIRNYILGVDTVQSGHLYSLGVHPWYLQVPVDNIEKIFSDTVLDRNFVAVGECGMDLLPEMIEKYPPIRQETIFVKQLYWAEKNQKPVIIHCVRCYDILLRLNKQIYHQNDWIIHGFSKQKTLALQLIQAGFFLSFGANLFRNEKNRQALKAVPLSRLFLETDEQNEYDIIEIYQKAAEIKEISVCELQKQILNNYQKVFGNKT